MTSRWRSQVWITIFVVLCQITCALFKHTLHVDNPSSLYSIAQTGVENRKKLDFFIAKGDMVGLEKLSRAIIQQGKKELDGKLKKPSVFMYLGVAQYNLGHIQDATETFEAAIQYNDDDAESWLHLGDCYLSQFKVAKACSAFETAIKMKGIKDVSKLYKARSWIADWTDRDKMVDQMKDMIHKSIEEVI